MARTQLCISMRRRQVKFYHSGSLPFPFWTVNGSFGSHLGGKPGGVSRNAGGFCWMLYQPLRIEHLRVLEKHAAADKGSGQRIKRKSSKFHLLSETFVPLIFFKKKLVSRLFVLAVT